MASAFPTSLPYPERSRSRSALIHMTLLALVVASCSTTAPPRCTENKDKIEACNREFFEDPCASPADRCKTACWATLSCGQLNDVDDGTFSPKLVECLTRCVETFTCKDDGSVIEMRWVCDGERDCVDGSDERRCEYFECDEGSKIRADFQCDDFEQCPDGSDEESCL